MQTLTDHDRELIAAMSEANATRILSRLEDPEVAERVLDTWTGHVQKIVGRAVLRIMWIVFFGCLLVAGFKLGLLDRIYKP